MNPVERLSSAQSKADLGYVALLMLGLATLWTSVVWINQRAENQGLEDMRRETAALALLFATQADTTFRTVDLALKELRKAAELPPTALAEVIAPHQELLGAAIVQTGLVNAQGMVTYSTPIPASQPTFSGDREFFTVHQRSNIDTLFVGPPVKGRLSNKWSIHLSRPIFKNGQFAGVALIAVDPDYFVSFYQSAGLGDRGAARMIRDTGEIMARSSEQEKFVGKVIKPSPYADPGAPLQGSFRRKAQADGVDRLSSYHRLAQYGVTVVIGPGVDERLVHVRAHQRQLLWAASLISLLLLLISWGLRQSAVRNRAARRALAQTQAKFRLLFENMTEAVSLNRLRLDDSGRAVNYDIVTVNPAFVAQTGRTAAQVQGRPVTEVFGLPEAPLLEVYAKVVQTGEHVRFEHHVGPANKDFEIHAFRYEPDHFATVYVDVSERNANHRQLQQQFDKIVQLQSLLQEQVLHDPLTQLHNRRFLDETLPREFARAKRDQQPIAFVVIDIDHFKRVNDTHGHAVGDLVLKRLASLLKKQARESDLLCRFGGEEFFLVMPGTTPEQAQAKTDAIRTLVAQTVIDLEGAELHITVSAGVAGYPGHGHDSDTLFKLAVKALYAAKSGGRNRVVMADVSLPDAETSAAGS